MSKYTLIIEEHIPHELRINLYTKNIVSIEGDSLLELMGKLPLEILRMTDRLYKEIKSIKDDDIPF